MLTINVNSVVLMLQLRALEVDHIVPKSPGGPDSLDNYQALCYYKCNTNKGNRSDIDLRGLAEDYVEYGQCIFCDQSEVLGENELAKAFYDKFPKPCMTQAIVPKKDM